MYKNLFLCAGMILVGNPAYAMEDRDIEKDWQLVVGNEGESLPIDSSQTEADRHHRGELPLKKMITEYPETVVTTILPTTSTSVSTTATPPTSTQAVTTNTPTENPNEFSVLCQLMDRTNAVSEFILNTAGRYYVELLFGSCYSDPDKDKNE